MQCGDDNDLNDVSCGCRQQPSMAQRQTGSAGWEEVGLEGLEGSNVVHLHLFIHSRCYHVSAKTGDTNNRLLSGGH